MVICVAVDSQSDSRQWRACILQISKGRKSETAMSHNNKTKKYPVDATCQNVSCLLFWLKSNLEKDTVSAGLK